MTTEQKIQELEKQIEELKNQSQKEEMEQWFKSLLNGLQIEINDNVPESVFYKKYGKVFFELYQGSEKNFYCDYTLVWSIFYNKYNLNYDETQSFIKNMVEQYLKLGVVIPGIFLTLTGLLVEERLKLGVVTPASCYSFSPIW